MARSKAKKFLFGNKRKKAPSAKAKGGIIPSPSSMKGYPPDLIKVLLMRHEGMSAMEHKN